MFNNISEVAVQLHFGLLIREMYCIENRKNIGYHLLLIGYIFKTLSLYYRLKNKNSVTRGYCSEWIISPKPNSFLNF